MLSGARALALHAFLGAPSAGSVVKEGGKDLGWVMPGKEKFDYPPSGPFQAQALHFFQATNGGERAMVPIGNYERR